MQTKFIRVQVQAPGYTSPLYLQPFPTRAMEYNDNFYSQFLHDIDSLSSPVAPNIESGSQPYLSSLDAQYQHIPTLSTTSIGDSSSVASLSGTGHSASSSVTSLSVPDAFSGQIEPLMQNAVNVLPVLEALRNFPMPSPASKKSFIRMYPVWKSHLESVIFLAASLAFHDSVCIMVAASASEYTQYMIKHTIRSVLFIFNADKSSGGTFERDGAGM
jgi:hypothetical protein